MKRNTYSSLVAVAALLLAQPSVFAKDKKNDNPQAESAGAPHGAGKHADKNPGKSPGQPKPGDFQARGGNAKHQSSAVVTQHVNPNGPENRVKQNNIRYNQAAAVTTQRNISDNRQKSANYSTEVNRNSSVNVHRNYNYSNYTRSNQYGGRWVAGNTYPHWNRNEVHFYNNHHYRWYDGGWLIVDGGFWPVPVTNTVVYTSGGSIGAQVQARLADQGYYNGPVDGAIGPMSRQAIAAYQNDHGLYPSGRINSALLSSLGLQ